MTTVLPAYGHAGLTGGANVKKPGSVVLTLSIPAAADPIISA